MPVGCIFSMVSLFVDILLSLLTCAYQGLHQSVHLLEEITMVALFYLDCVHVVLFLL